MPRGRKAGRPSLYSKALAEKICERIALGETLNEVRSASLKLFRARSFVRQLPLT